MEPDVRWYHWLGMLAVVGAIVAVEPATELLIHLVKMVMK